MKLREIKGYENLYAVDSEGRVYSLQQTSSRRKGQLATEKHTSGYLRVNLYRDGRVKHCYIHRLVAEAFFPNPDGFPVVNHKDADKHNNRVENLEWCSQKDNILESRKMGNQKKDIPVRVESILGGDEMVFRNLREASIFLFDRYWMLTSHRSRQQGKDVFVVGQWRIEIGGRV